MLRLIVIVLFTVSLLSNAIAGKVTDKDKPKNNCPPGEHWVRPHPQSSYPRDGTIVSGSFHKASCSKNPRAYAVWNERLKSGLPPKWELKNEKVKIWTEREKEDVIESLSNLPTALLVETVTGIYRMAQSTSYGANPAAGFNHNIAIYDPAFKSENNLTRILGHEFAHEIYRQMPITDRKDYVKAAEWAVEEEIPGKLTLIPGRTGFVEEDGRNSVDEDFSNNIEYFLFNPLVLKAKSPKVFDWISKKFGDKFKMGGKNK